MPTDKIGIYVKGEHIADAMTTTLEVTSTTKKYGKLYLIKGDKAFFKTKSGGRMTLERDGLAESLKDVKRGYKYGEWLTIEY